MHINKSTSSLTQVAIDQTPTRTMVASMTYRHVKSFWQKTHLLAVELSREGQFSYWSTPPWAVATTFLYCWQFSDTKRSMIIC